MQRAIKWATGLLCAIAFFCGGFVILHGFLPPASINAWLPAGDLTAARSGAASVLLQDGRLLITGGNGASGALATTEILDPANGFTAGPPMNLARSNHVAVLLQDGRVLVAGGTDASGRASQSAELFDAAANSWSAAGPLMVGRSGATATLLPSGQVLIAGGAGNGAALASLELFDPSSNTFSLVAGALSSPRENHAAAMLPDGRVLITGGWDGTTLAPVPPATAGTANVLASTDIFDPSTGAVAPGPALTSPRMNFTATTALDGSIIAIGGTDGQNDLASIEVLAPGAGAFALSGAKLATARQGHQAFLLPHNSNVLVVGGTSSGAAISSAELYTPWTGATSVTSAMASARSGATGSPLFQNVLGAPVGIDGALLVAGGLDASSPPSTLQSAEVYGFATITTDKSDYPPGVPVTITGKGWQPGEVVQMSLVEVPDLDGDSPIPLSATADASGNIINNSFSTNIEDANIHFTLTAIGGASQAQTTFTDKNVSVSCSPNPVANNTGSTCTVSVQGGAVGATVNWTTSGTGTFTPSASCTVNNANPNQCSVTYTPTAVGTGTHTITATYTGSGGGSGSTGLGVFGPAVKLALSGATTDLPAGSTRMLTATIQDASGNTVAAGADSTLSVSFAKTGGAGTVSGLGSSSAVAGVATITVTGNLAGSVTITASATGSGGALLAGTGNPITFNVVPAATPDHFVFAAISSPQTAGTAFNVTITAQDAFNNTVTSFSGGGNKVSISSTGTLSGGTFTSNAFTNGVLTQSVTITNTGNFTITATGTGSPKPIGTSNSFTVNPGPVSASTSTVAASPASVPADNSTTSTITVTLKDANNNPVSGKTVSLTAGSGNSTISAPSGVSDANGVVTFTVKDGTAETVTYSAKDTTDNTTITQTATVTFTSVTVGTSTTVVSSVNPSVFGQSVTFTADVHAASGSTAPTGTVQFVIDGSNYGSPVTLGACIPSSMTDACASTSTAALTVNGGVAHTVTANYTHTGSFSDSSGSLSGGQTVNKADTTTTVGTITPEPSLVGQSYTVNYTVVAKSPGSGTPTGNVTVDDGNGNQCTATVAAASCSLASTSTGTKTITATYAGDTSFNGSNGTGSHVVSKRPTSTTVTSISPGSVALGVGATVTVTVVDTGAGAASNPTGTAALSSTDTNGSFSTCTLSQGVNPAGTVSCTATYTPGGTITGTTRTDTITASFTASDNVHQDSSDTTGKPVTVTKRLTSTTVTSLTPSSVVVAQSTTVRVTVVDTDSGTVSNPSGTVSLGTTGAGAFGSCTLAQGANPAGTVSCDATYTPSSAAASPQTITASFTATDNVHQSSADNTGKSLTVTRRSTSTTVGLSPASVVTGQSSSVTVTVADTESAGTKQFPTGTVTVTSSDANDVFTGTCTLASTLTSGQSTCSVSVKPPHVGTGSHTITATFAQTDVHLGSNGGTGLTVTKANTTTTVAASTNPIILGQSVSFTATVAVVSPGSGTPTGNVQFYIDGVAFGSSVALSGGSAASGSTTTLTAGPHNITAVYSGDDDFFGSNNNSSPLVENVNYNFLGLFDPYAPPPRGYKVKSAVPLVWQYADINGTVVNSSNANPAVQIYVAGACGGTDTGDILNIQASGNSGYQYDSTTNTWQFNWKTTGMNPGCYNVYIHSNLTGQTSQAFPIQLVR
ncbi:MAG TPA: Ig-like domain repeat protein [Terriglobia bacterium]|nr:Ig-like domain repeat protein [Terriglobia bacterium]